VQKREIRLEVNGQVVRANNAKHIALAQLLSRPAKTICSGDSVSALGLVP